MEVEKLEQQLIESRNLVQKQSITIEKLSAENEDLNNELCAVNEKSPDVEVTQLRRELMATRFELERLRMQIAETNKAGPEKTGLHGSGNKDTPTKSPDLILKHKFSVDYLCKVAEEGLQKEVTNLLFPSVSPDTNYNICSNLSLALGKACVNVGSVYTDIASKLLSSGASALQKIKEESNKTPMHIACEFGNADILEIFLDQDDFNQKVLENLEIKDDTGNTPLSLALANDNAKCAELLMMLGCNCSDDKSSYGSFSIISSYKAS